MFKKTKAPPKCKNCLLFDGYNGKCKVLILYYDKDTKKEEKTNLSVGPDDDCFFENTFEAVNNKGEKEPFKVEVNQIRVWAEDPNTGKPSPDGKGIIKMEYPSTLTDHGNN